MIQTLLIKSSSLNNNLNMKQTSQLQKAAFSNLFKRIQLSTGSSTSHHVASDTKPSENQSTNNPHKQSPFSPQGKWERSFDKLTESLYGPLPMTDREAQSLAGSLNKYLVSNLQKRSQKVQGPLSDHFMDLFTGLNRISGKPGSHISNSEPDFQKQSTHSKYLHRTSNILSMPPSLRLSLLASCTSNAELEAYFKELYYSGNVTKSLLVTILNNKNFTSLDTVSRFILSGIPPRNLPVSTLHYVRLFMANRYWALGRKDAAKSLIVDSWKPTWEPALKANTLQQNSVQGLIKALIAFGKLDLLKDVIGEWRDNLTVVFNGTKPVEEFQEGIIPAVLSIFIALFRTKRYTLSKSCTEVGIIFFSKLLERCPQNPQNSESTRLLEQSHILFQSLSSISSLPPSILESELVAKHLTSLYTNMENLQTLFAKTRNFSDHEVNVKIQKEIGSATINFADIATGAFTELSAQTSSSNEINLTSHDIEITTTQLEKIVSLLKPELSERMTNKYNAPVAGHRESISIALALQKIRSIEAHLKKNKEGGDNNGSSKRPEVEPVSTRLVWE